MDIPIHFYIERWIRQSLRHRFALGLFLIVHYVSLEIQDNRLLLTQFSHSQQIEFRINRGLDGYDCPTILANVQLRSDEALHGLTEGDKGLFWIIHGLLGKRPVFSGNSRRLSPNQENMDRTISLTYPRGG